VFSGGYLSVILVFRLYFKKKEKYGGVLNISFNRLGGVWRSKTK